MPPFCYRPKLEEFLKKQLDRAFFLGNRGKLVSGALLALVIGYLALFTLVSERRDAAVWLRRSFAIQTSPWTKNCMWSRK